MQRAFSTHRIRPTRELEGLWDFSPLAPDEQPGPHTRYDYRLPVPGCWEMHPEFLTYRGRAAYRSAFSLETSSTVRLIFKGVSHSAVVLVDGVEVTRHHNAYTPFEATVANLAPGDHELVLIVDNRYGAASALHVPNDYFTYGGPIRPVVLEVVPATFLEFVAFEPRGKRGQWSAQVTVGIRFLTDPHPVRLSLNLAGSTLEVSVAPTGVSDSHVITVSLPCPGAPTWSPSSPSLCHLEVRLFDEEGRPTDDLIERVGFRTVSWDGGEFRLNGDTVRLVGFNRHEDHPAVGAAIPFALMVRDLDLMQSAGANAVRTSHYPNDELFLDLCDERGLLVWEENHARGLSLAQMQHPLFEAQCEAVNGEMVGFHRNHPSIVIWGLLNECASNTPEGRRMYQAQFGQIRRLDSTRPVTFASCHHGSDLCHDLSDIVSLNLYAGWYEEISPRELLDKALEHADGHGAEGKAVIVSEFGADGFYGFRDPSRVRGSEERQGDILAENLQTFLADPRIVGVFIWQFCDCRTHDGGGWFVTRGRSRNNKGVVDEYRRPKLAYEVVKGILKRR